MNIGGIHIEGEQELKAQILKFIIERETLFLFFMFMYSLSAERPAWRGVFL